MNWTFTQFKQYVGRNGYVFVDDQNAIKGDTRICFNDANPMRIIGNNHDINDTGSNIFDLYPIDTKSITKYERTCFGISMYTETGHYWLCLHDDYELIDPNGDEIFNFKNLAQIKDFISQFCDPQKMSIN